MVCFFSRLDVNNDLMSLHIGDKILEINGMPVRDTPLENVEGLLKYSDTVLQVRTLLLIIFHEIVILSSI